MNLATAARKTAAPNAERPGRRVQTGPEPPALGSKRSRRTAGWPEAHTVSPKGDVAATLPRDVVDRQARPRSAELLREAGRARPRRLLRGPRRVSGRMGWRRRPRARPRGPRRGGPVQRAARGPRPAGPGRAAAGGQQRARGRGARPDVLGAEVGERVVRGRTRGGLGGAWSTATRRRCGRRSAFSRRRRCSCGVGRAARGSSTPVV